MRRRNGIGGAISNCWRRWALAQLDDVAAVGLLAAAFGLGLAVRRGRHPRRGWRTPQPFGIALAAAGWLQLLMGADQSALTLFR